MFADTNANGPELSGSSVPFALSGVRGISVAALQPSDGATRAICMDTYNSQQRAIQVCPATQQPYAV
eukprot:scaffold679631_cov56-Prasinocladus_malaysianus.AAC.1